MDLDKYKIEESFGNIETHEVFLDTLAHKKEEEFGLSEKKFEVKIKEKLIYSIFALFLVFSAILFSKTFYLAIFEGKNLYSMAENNKGTIDLIRPERGIIYDKNLKKLVLNSPGYDFVCDKRSFSQFEAQSKQEIETMASILGKSYADLENEFQASEEPKILIQENLDQKTLLMLEARGDSFHGCQIEKNTIRNYVMGPVFSHALGYIGRINKEDLKNTTSYTISDYIGKDGLEKQYEEELRGTPGRTEIVKSASGVKKGDTMLSQPEQGHSLVLHIDADLQKKVYDSLEKSIKNIGVKKGAAVAIDPRNGAILALVSYPAYDNNIFSKGISKQDFNALQNDSSQPFFNRVISAQYPVGSTIKPFLASGALQEKIISPNKLINDTGYISIVNQYNPDIVYTFSGVKPHGLVDMIKAIAVSSNIYFFTVGGGYKDQEGLGPSRIKKYLDLFGWEQKTGIDLPG